MLRDDITQYLLSKITETSKKIRTIEDDCAAFFVAPESNGVYNALVGYRRALQDALQDIRSMNDSGSIRKS